MSDDVIKFDNPELEFQYRLAKLKQELFENNHNCEAYIVDGLLQGIYDETGKEIRVHPRNRVVVEEKRGEVVAFKPRKSWKERARGE